MAGTRARSLSLSTAVARNPDSPFHDLPALAFRDTLAGLHLAWLIFEVGQPTVLKDGTVAGLSFNFESSIVIKKLEQGRVRVAGSDGEEIQTFPSGKRVAGSGINPYRPRLWQFPTAALKKVPRTAGWLAVPLQPQPFDDGRASASIPQIEMDHPYVVTHIACAIAQNRQRGSLDLLLIGGDELLHRAPVMDRDNQGNDRNKNRRAGKDQVKPRYPGTMPVRVAFMFNHRMQSFKAAYDNNRLGQVLSRSAFAGGRGT